MIRLYFALFYSVVFLPLTGSRCARADSLDAVEAAYNSGRYDEAVRLLSSAAAFEWYSKAVGHQAGDEWDSSKLMQAVADQLKKIPKKPRS